MTNANKYQPRHAVEPTYDRWSMIRASLGTTATYCVVLMQVEFGVIAGFANMPRSTADHQPSAYPALSQRATEVFQRVFHADTPIVCDDVVLPLPDSASPGNTGVYGAVMTYAPLMLSRRPVASNIIHLKREICDNLASIPDGINTPLTDDQLLALHVVQHEKIHTEGQFDEKITECEALQRLPAQLIADGVSEATVAGYRNTALGQYATKLEPTIYHSDECRAGGELDQTPNSIGNVRLSDVWLPHG